MLKLIFNLIIVAFFMFLISGCGGYSVGDKIEISRPFTLYAYSTEEQCRSIQNSYDISKRNQMMIEKDYWIVPSGATIVSTDGDVAKIEFDNIDITTKTKKKIQAYVLKKDLDSAD